MKEEVDTFTVREGKPNSRQKENEQLPSTSKQHTGLKFDRQWESDLMKRINK